MARETRSRDDPRTWIDDPAVAPVMPAKRSKFRAWIVAVAVTGVCVAAVGYTGVSIKVADRLSSGNHKPLGALASSISSRFEAVAFASRVDHVALKGWLFRSPNSTGRSAILVHGHNQNRVNQDYGAPALTRNLLAHGFDVLLFDLRGSGVSGGRRSTLGTLEPRDLLGAHDFMRGRGYRPPRMAIIGDSMGAATTLEAAPQLSDVGALVVDSAYAELRPLLDASLPKNSHLPAFFNWGIETAATVLDDTNANLRPVDAVRSQPSRAFLFFQGLSDSTVPPEQGDELRKASTNPESLLVTIPGAEHVKSFRTQPDLYLRVLYQFLDQQFAERAG